MVPGWFSWFFMIPGWFMMVPGWFFMVPGGFSWLFITIPTKKYCTAKYYIIIGRPRWDRQYYLGIVWELCLGLTGCGASFCFTRHRIVLREHLIFFWTCHQIIHKTQVPFSSCLCTWSARSYFVVDWNEWSVPKQGQEIIHPPSWPWPYLQFLLLIFLSCVHLLILFCCILFLLILFYFRISWPWSYPQFLFWGIFICTFCLFVFLQFILWNTYCPRYYMKNLLNWFSIFNCALVVFAVVIVSIVLALALSCIVV